MLPPVRAPSSRSDRARPAVDVEPRADVETGRERGTFKPMPRDHCLGRRAPITMLTVAGLAAAGLAAGVAGVGVPVAAASSRHALPKVQHARDLTAEPAVRAVKGKAPKKLLVKDLVTGTGSAVTKTSIVQVKYIGANYRTGKDFTAATWTAGKATSFSLSGVIPGFADGLLGMKVGGRREIVIPPRLGYGNHAAGPIKRNETLVFVVDLEAVSG